MSMGQHRKKKTISEKLEILKYYSLHGMARATREHEVSATSIYKWKKLYESEGEDSLSGKSTSKEDSAELKRLRRENDELKKIVAEKELSLRIQSEMLKKSTWTKKLDR